MAGAACKIKLKGGYAAAAKANEEVIRMERGGRLTVEEADELIQRMADIDLAAYHGWKVPEGGLVGVTQALIDEGIYTDEVWGIFARPGSYRR